MSRVFKLPNIEDLTLDQEKILALPVDGRHLIVGGPGTGKSVVALLRARKLARENKDYYCLAFNHPLLQANKQLFGEELKLSHAQWQTWFNQVYQQLLGHAVPTLPPKNPNSTYRPINWEKVLTEIREFKQRQFSQAQADTSADSTPLSKLPAFSYLILDEGQDMPLDFYRALINLGYENFFVVADQNQRIISNINSSLSDLQSALLVAQNDVFPLIENFRNNYAIARFADTFYNDTASPRPNLPEQPLHDVTRPMIYYYPPSRFEVIIERIATTAYNYPQELIGVICPNNEVRERYLKALENYIDNAQPPLAVILSTYESGGNHPELRFDRGGIMVINAQACKGLEFDRVFLTDVNEYKKMSNDYDNLKKLFYVMTSRAKNNLVLLLPQGSDDSIIQPILTQDTQILERKP